MSADRWAKWTNGAVAAEAPKYQTIAAFKRGSDRAYRAAKSRGLLDQVCEHMPGGQSGYKPHMPGTLYLMRLDAAWELFPVYKVGITNHSAKVRAASWRPHPAVKMTALQEVRYEDGRIAARHDQFTLKTVAGHRYTGRRLIDDGFRELLTVDPRSITLAEVREVAHG